MSPGVHILRRVRVDGVWRAWPAGGGRIPQGTPVRWIVRYREGGRAAPVRHDSSWDTQTNAIERKRTIERAWAMGNPTPPVVQRVERSITVGDAVTHLIEVRIDVGPRRRENYEKARKALGRLAATGVDDLTPAAIRSWVAELAAARRRATIANYLGVVRMALDLVEVDPNPARHPSVKLPRADEGDGVGPIPTLEEWRGLLEATAPRRHRLTLQVLEGSGLRLGELQHLTWRDVDLRLGRLRVAAGKTRAARRWVPIEPALADLIAASCPPDDRLPERPVIPGLAAQTIRGVLARASRNIGSVQYSPHALRRRWISLMLVAGVPLAVVRDMAGHTRGSITTDAYMGATDDDPRRLQALRDAAARHAAGYRDAPVRHDHHTHPDGGVVPPANSPSRPGMEHGGLEPPTSWVRSRRSPS